VTETRIARADDGLGLEETHARLARACEERDLLRAENETLRTNLRLLDELRVRQPGEHAIAQAMRAPLSELVALSEISQERRLQDAVFGKLESLVDVPDGTGGAFAALALIHIRAEVAAHEQRTRRQTCCWGHTVLEEAYEVLAETDPAKLRAELVQLGAVCCWWIEILDLRAGATK
jgi:hypothetical protein